VRTEERVSFNEIVAARNEARLRLRSFATFWMMHLAVPPRQLGWTVNCGVGLRRPLSVWNEVWRVRVLEFVLERGRFTIRD
jgi:hypothetical protein